MTRFRLTLVLMAFAILSSGIAAAQEKDISKGIVRGYIIDTTPAQLPIAGVRVQIDNGKGDIFETTSAETGVFVYTDIPADDYLINLHKPGYHSRIGKPLVVTSSGVHSVPLTMNKQEGIFTKFQNLFRSEEPQGGTLQLQVTTPSPQSVPIENAKVAISQIRRKGSFPANNIRITDAIGQYRHDNLPQGRYFVTVGKDSYHTTISIPVEENRMTTAAVEFPISNGTADINVLPPHEMDTKWMIRGKVFEIDFQQTPVSDVEVRLRGNNFKHPKIAYSNAGGEYEFGLLPGHYSIYLDKDGYEDASVHTEVAVKIRQSSVTVIKEGMFVVYEAVAKGNMLTLKHGISKKSFSEKYGRRIRYALLSAIISGILGFFLSRYLNKRQRKNNQE
ncbi:carboxypeptidase regulatory-like domain-containing protein [Candidatus Poribacteria bacterium]|nr:carboxypeptidase regulatory-like domain-containing protein [Candidatus Poribacteria bacterium]MYG05222.1 carboxypeptidase regulatory-like domain-containing protein [Candidatus Poribacteria bacterium]MYK24858.1 carboxypeptidase regulatory-like domain-containing protein [Candidatus Poribacteria bacterium]